MIKFWAVNSVIIYNCTFLQWDQLSLGPYRFFASEDIAGIIFKGSINSLKWMRVQDIFSFLFYCRSFCLYLFQNLCLLILYVLLPLPSLAIFNLRSSGISAPFLKITTEIRFKFSQQLVSLVCNMSIHAVLRGFCCVLVFPEL